MVAHEISTTSIDEPKKQFGSKPPVRPPANAARRQEGKRRKYTQGKINKKINKEEINIYTTYIHWAFMIYRLGKNANIRNKSSTEGGKGTC